VELVAWAYSGALNKSSDCTRACALTVWGGKTAHLLIGDTAGTSVVPVLPRPRGFVQVSQSCCTSVVPAAPATPTRWHEEPSPHRTLCNPTL